MTWATVLRIARLESRRLLRNPVFVAACLLSGYLVLYDWLPGPPPQSWST